MQAISAPPRALAPLDTRPLFPVAATCAYLNHAAVSPLATPTRRAMEELLATSCGPGVRDWRARFARLEEIRALLARLVGAAPAEIAFTKNTTEALSIVAQGLDWRPGDRVVSFESEFPANLYPWLALRPRGVTVELLPEAAILDLDRLRRACRSVRLLSLSFVQYLSGLRADLAAIGAICRETGTLFVVDGIQGLGAFPIDVKACGIHALANGAQKWLMAPEGAGFLFLDQAVLEQFQPREVGWL
ncbi:MAG: aminotransferase class V-fold PLP-dependent enzyme, partial [Terriglobales bacterium]